MTISRGVVQGQEQQRKVLTWPNQAAIVGYVGLGAIGDETLEDWLWRFIVRHLIFDHSPEVAEALRIELEQEIPADDQKEQLTLHLATFEPGRDVPVLPKCWYITNNTPTEPIRPSIVREEPGRREYFGQFAESEWQWRMARAAERFEPFWFHQGSDLPIFNTLEGGVKAALDVLVGAGAVPFPTTLKEWERFARFQVLMYGGYFEAYKRPYERLVGGGADAVSLPWALPPKPAT